jgi:protocatechuate 3,4-dioxygenase beta subunit
MGSLTKALVAVGLCAAGCAGARTAAPSATATATATAATAPPGTGAAACGAATPAETEGPFYKAGPPQRTTLVETGTAGTKLSLTGVVRDTSCAPIPGARVDFWQADAQGNYDTRGYRLRGYQLTDKQGAYRLETVMPGEYPGRTVHIHVKVTPPGDATLTTQLFEPGFKGNDSDSIYNAALLMKMPSANVATFDFVVAR